MCKPKPPVAPDPLATISAQTASNKDTALTSAALNRVDQNTPYGSSTYTTDGTDANGVPKYTQNVTLAPEQQQIFDNYTKGQIGLGNTALQMQGQVADSYRNPIDTSGIKSLNGDYSQEMQQAQDAAYAKNTQYLDPQFAEQQQELNARLANQGLSTGGEAYDKAQGQFGRTRQMAYDDARNSAIAQGNAEQNQLFNQDSSRLSRLFALRNQPLNEYNSLITGAQVQNPQFNAVPGANVANTDVGGITNNGYQNQMSAYNASQQGINNLFSLGGTLGAAAIMSDRRLKRDITRVGTTHGGIPTYTFRYNNDDDQLYFGVMADQVRHIPGAVVTMNNGYEAVNYAVVK